MRTFSFATGIEASCPKVLLPDGRTIRVDEYESTRHYARWRDDFGLVVELGLDTLRYGPPYHRTHLGPGRYDWSMADETFAELKRPGITPIVDLCHFGIPDRLKQDGVPIVGFTWYSLTDQVDWDSTLRENAGRVNARGLVDLDRNLRPVGAAYQRLVREWRPIMSTNSLLLKLGY